MQYCRFVVAGVVVPIRRIGQRYQSWLNPFLPIASLSMLRSVRASDSRRDANSATLYSESSISSLVMRCGSLATWTPHANSNCRSGLFVMPSLPFRCCGTGCGRHYNGGSSGGSFRANEPHHRGLESLHDPTARTHHHNAHKHHPNGR